MRATISSLSHWRNFLPCELQVNTTLFVVGSNLLTLAPCLTILLHLLEVKYVPLAIPCQNKYNHWINLVEVIGLVYALMVLQQQESRLCDRLVMDVCDGVLLCWWIA